MVLELLQWSSSVIEMCHLTYNHMHRSLGMLPDDMSIVEPVPDGRRQVDTGP